MAKNSNSTFRVYYIPTTDREQFATYRDVNGLTNERLIDFVVEHQLGAIVESLEAAGFRPDEERKATRWPVSEESLARLKEASERVGVPASQLLLLSIRAEAGTGTEPAKMPRKGRGATTRAAKTAKTPRSPRKSSKATGGTRKGRAGAAKAAK